MGKVGKGQMPKGRECCFQKQRGNKMFRPKTRERETESKRENYSLSMYIMALSSGRN